MIIASQELADEQLTYSYPNLNCLALQPEATKCMFVNGLHFLIVNINGFRTNFQKLLNLIDTLYMLPHVIVVSELRLLVGFIENYDIPGFTFCHKLRVNDP